MPVLWIKKITFVQGDILFLHLNPLYIKAIKKAEKEKKNKATVLTDHFYRDLIDITDDLYFLTKGCTKLINDPAQLGELGYLNSH